MSHPDASGPPDRRPIEAGEVWENPVTRERAVVLELPWQNGEGRGVAELTALPGARVMGEHLHPALDERFSVLQGELTVVRDGRRSVLGAGESAHIEPGVWHDWWNDAQAHAVVRVEVDFPRFGGHGVSRRRWSSLSRSSQSVGGDFSRTARARSSRASSVVGV